MKKEKIKSILLIVIPSIIALALIALMVVAKLRENKTIGSSESSEIIEEFKEEFNDEERTIIYFASPSCQYCILQTPVLETIADDYDLDYYYLDSSQLSNSQTKEVMELLELEKASTPTTVVVEKGKVIDTQVGYKAGKEYVEFLIGAGMLPKGAKYSAEEDITFINYDEYKELIGAQDPNVIVIGQTGCSHCTSFKPAINAVADNYDITINYLNLTEMTEDESNSFFESLKDLEYNDPDFVEKGSFGTPLTIIVENGKITNYISGARTTSQLARQLKKFGVISE